MKGNTIIGEERVLPGAWLPPWTLFEHEARYIYSAQYVAGKTVVDCACGNGVGAKIFLKNDPLQYYGFDVDKDSIDFSAKYLTAKNSEFKRADALALPLQDNAADVFISLETIEHINDDRGYISEIARVLKPNGLLILSTPNRLVTNPGSEISDPPWNQFHIREYSPTELIKLFEEQFVIEFWSGQNANSQAKIAVLRFLSKILGKNAVVRMNQLWKCRWFLFPNKKYHNVVRSKNRNCDEYMVILFRRK